MQSYILFAPNCEKLLCSFLTWLTRVYNLLLGERLSLLQDLSENKMNDDEKYYNQRQVG